MNINTDYKLVEYIGDSVYIGLDTKYSQLWIFTCNGEETKNDICLEDDVLGNLIVAVRKFGYKDLIRGPNE